MQRVKLKVKCHDLEEHPHCPHGPTLLFYNDADGETCGYYACSAHRDKSNCSFHMPASEWVKARPNKKTYNVPTAQLKLIRDEITLSTVKSLSKKSYCHTCNIVFLKSDLRQHEAHLIETTLLEKHLQDPTSLLKPLSDDKSQAQYFFDDKALNYFEQCVNKLNISKVICIGAPRLHTYLCAKTKTKSFLLDFDERFLYFLRDNEYAWYNMCNNWFFDDAQKQEFHKFLRCDNDEKVLIFTDPPFGCRTEPIASTLRSINTIHNTLNQLPQQPLPIFWIFPYFSEHYIRTEMPQLEMCDYMINYTNHDNYTDTGKHRREQGSPVRIFTNVPQHQLPLPTEPEYRHCNACERFVINENKHCSKCGICPSKNGGRYKHCLHCAKCVKVNYKHCHNCRRCTQVHGHKCVEYQRNQFCWICLQCGHTENNCGEWRAFCMRKGIKRKFIANENQIVCLLCGLSGHNERYCPKRGMFIEEFSFLGETEVKLKC